MKKIIQNKIDTNLINHWSSLDNSQFYENISIESLSNLAREGGLDSACDVERVKRYWENAENILDVGAGYGRVCDGLLNLGFKGNICAVERSKQFCHFLRKKFGNKISLFESDLMELETPIKFDAIFFMWLANEFNKDELTSILKHLSSFLSDKGVLITDIFSYKADPMNSTQVSQGNCIIKINNCSVYAYLFSQKEIEDIKNLSNLKTIFSTSYLTSMGRERISYVFSKS